MWETIAQPEGTPLPAYRHEWVAGETVLEVMPNDAPGNHRRLKWGQWLRTLRGVALWWRAYPGLYVGFEIYEREWEMVGYYLGSGQLMVRG